jgi:CRISPR-associated protein Csy1
VVQNFGGTKPQNISQLNSERGGKSYLLSSAPPTWKPQVNLPLKKESIFDDWFPNRPEVKHLTKSLREFLYRVQDANNRHIRDTRKAFVKQIIDELLATAAELREREEAWTERSSCKLNDSQQLWLNPYRCQHDDAFNKRYQLGDWKEEVCRHFSLWLNVVINDKKKPLPLGEAEANEWRSTLKDELRLLALEVATYE